LTPQLENVTDVYAEIARSFSVELSARPEVVVLFHHKQTT
jgi:hypothetical protein